MLTRRKFLMMSAGAGLLLSVPMLARTGVQPAQAATAITQVFGDGIRLTAVAVEYPTEVSAEGLNPADFHVEGRTVTGVWTSTSTNPADIAPSGRYMIIALSPDDKNATLAEQVQPNSKTTATNLPMEEAAPVMQAIFLPMIRFTGQLKPRYCAFRQFIPPVVIRFPLARKR